MGCRAAMDWTPPYESNKYPQTTPLNRKDDINTTSSQIILKIHKNRYRNIADFQKKPQNFAQKLHILNICNIFVLQSKKERLWQHKEDTL